MEENIMKVNLKVWRQANPREKGGFVTYSDVETTPDTSFLETSTFSTRLSLREE